MAKTAVILFNLGGPDKPAAVEPFLFNLFFDPAIIGLPTPLRWLVAKLVSKRRAPTARAIYEKIGGGSPLLPETRAQADALQTELGPEFKVLIAMRYWHPFTEQAVAAARAWGAERVLLVPLYPQYSKTTTGSSLACWRDAAEDWPIPTKAIRAYPTLPGLVAAIADRVRETAATLPGARILFSAHGLPKKVVVAGDPYPEQVMLTARAVVVAIGIAGLDWAVCYQSRVGPLEWIGPPLEDELARAAADQLPVIVVPIAFVSEHSETLVELDIEYRHRADDMGVPGYARVPAVGCHPAFIAGLAEMVRLEAS